MRETDLAANAVVAVVMLGLAITFGVLVAAVGAVLLALAALGWIIRGARERHRSH